MTRLRVRIATPNFHGDTVWCRGKVKAKTVDDTGRGLVECAVEAVNQKQVVTAPGTATVRLPGRGNSRVEVGQ